MASFYQPCIDAIVDTVKVQRKGSKPYISVRCLDSRTLGQTLTVQCLDRVPRRRLRLQPLAVFLPQVEP